MQKESGLFAHISLFLKDALMITIIYDAGCEMVGKV